MRGLLRTAWCVVLIAVYIMIVGGLLFKDAVTQGEKFDTVFGNTGVIVSQPFALEAGDCNYFILTGPNETIISAKPIEEPVGQDCNGDSYYVARAEHTVAGKWKAVEGRADVRIKSLDGKPVTATIPNETGLDAFLAFLIFCLFSMVTVLFFVTTENTSTAMPSWLKNEERSSSSTRSSRQ